MPNTPPHEAGTMLCLWTYGKMLSHSRDIQRMDIDERVYYIEKNKV
jgi:hypothetical protein